MRLASLGVLAASFSALALARGDGHGPKTARTSAMADNPFMQPSTLPFELPPFDRIRDSDYLPAFQAGMREQLTEVARIAHNPQPAAFDNTIVALERAGQLLQRVDAAFGRLNACNTNTRMQEIDTEMAPKLTAQEDAIHLDPALWARVDALYEKRSSLHLDPESLQLLARYHTEFVRAGARLTAAEQTRLRALNTEISSLTTRFKHNVLKATAAGAVAVEDLKDLEGLSQEQIGAGAQGTLRFRSGARRAVLRARSRAAGWCVLRRARALWPQFQGAPGPARLPAGCAGVRGIRRRRPAARVVPGRLLRTRQQAGRGVDGRLRVAVAVAASQAGGGQSPEHPQAPGRPAGAAHFR